jgi:hypothetical protein
MWSPHDPNAQKCKGVFVVFSEKGRLTQRGEKMAYMNSVEFNFAIGERTFISNMFLVKCCKFRKLQWTKMFRDILIIKINSMEAKNCTYKV